MKDPGDELKLVIVRDMWLTGFDAPCLNTMYVDKPMKGHNLMQAIARVNRVFRDKPGGLVVDYLGIGTDLKKALSFYGEAGGKGSPAENIARAYEILHRETGGSTAAIRRRKSQHEGYHLRRAGCLLQKQS